MYGSLQLVLTFMCAESACNQMLVLFVRGPVHRYTFKFVNVYFFLCTFNKAFRPHVNDVNDLCKRIFSKTPARVDKFIDAQNTYLSALVWTTQLVNAC